MIEEIAEQATEGEHVLSVRREHQRRRKAPRTSGRVLKAGTVPENVNTVRLVGGDSNVEADALPAIIIVRNGEEIKKIEVQCPCGRHAELICDYDEEEPDA